MKNTEKLFSKILNKNCIEETVFSENVRFYTFSLPDTPEGIASDIQLTAPGRWMALALKGRNWMNPFYGKGDFSSLPEQTQFLMCQYGKDGFLMLLPLITGKIRGTLQNSKKRKLKIEIKYEGALQKNQEKSAVLLAAAAGSDPYRLVQILMEETSRKLKTFKVRTKKKKPDLISRFGWCSWDAFYENIDEKKVLATLESFRKSILKIEFMILDDGWQCVSREVERRLLSFQPDMIKFPGGLKKLVREAKRKYHLKYFGVWHAFEGYWNGIVPSSILPYKFIPARQPKNVSVNKDGTIPPQYNCTFVAPEDAGNFFSNYHQYLKEQGVDFVKADNQGAFASHFIKDYCIREEAVKAYSYALQDSAEKHFDGRLINCMGQGNDFYFHYKSANLWRNSDDYFPQKNVEEQYKHLHHNAKNAFFASTFCYPDWDMFQSCNTGAEFHAASRALSGGPVYICDKPGEQNFALLEQFADSNGNLLHVDDVALPSPDTLFSDPENEEIPLKIFNRSHQNFLLGFFNCFRGKKAILCEYSPQDIYSIKGEKFAVYSQKRGLLSSMKKEEKKHFTLSADDWDIFTFAPVYKNGFAAIGLSGKYIPSAVFLDVKASKNKLETRVCCGGTLLFYAETPPSCVKKNGEKIPFDFKEHLLTIRVNEKNPFTLTLEKQG